MAEVTEGENKARDGEGEHSHGVENLAAGQAGAGDDIGDGDAEDEIDDGGERGVFETILDGGEGQVVAEGGAEMVEGPAVGQDGAVPIAREGDEDDAEVGQHGEEGDGGEEEGDESADEGAGGAGSALAGGLGHHGMAGAADGGLAERIQQDRRDKHDDDEGEGEGVAADVLDAAENLHGGDAAEVEHEGHAELGEGPDEDDDAAGKEAGHDERKGDATELAEAGAAEVFGSFLHGRVDVGQGGDEVEIEDGVKVQGIHHHDAEHAALAQPVDGMIGVEQMKGLEKGIERAFLAEDLFDPDGADERRQDHGNENERGEEALAGKEVAVGQEGERQGNGGGEQGAPDGHLDRVPQTLEVNGIAEDLDDVVEGETAAGLTESAAEGFPNRKGEEEKEEECGEDIDRGGTEGMRFAIHLPSLASFSA